jgi:hypothetical protein
MGTTAENERSHRCAVNKKAAQMETNIGKELYKIMDALVALKIDLKCDPCTPGEILVLSADKARDACEALESASASIKHLAAALNGRPGGSAPPH